MEHILVVVVMLLLVLCIGLMWSTIRRMDAVTDKLRAEKYRLAAECNRLETANDKLCRWLKLNGEFVIDELNDEVEVLSGTPQTKGESLRRQIFLFDSLALMVWAGMEGAEEKTRETVRKKTEIFRQTLRERIKP